MAILSGPSIGDHVRSGAITIDPFELDNLNPASVDLRLGDEVAVYEDWVECSVADQDQRPVFDGHGLCSAQYFVQDLKQAPRTRRFKMDDDIGWVLHPGILYLMHTLERVHTDAFVPVLDGKSSIGRLGITIHLTAGFGDPGFDGQYTLEVTTVHPVRVYPGMRFCQMRFHHLEGTRLNYQETGHYTKAAALGAVPSLAHTQFKNS